jgi:hypothetical protein
MKQNDNSPEDPAETADYDKPVSPSRQSFIGGDPYDLSPIKDRDRGPGSGTCFIPVETEPSDDPVDGAVLLDDLDRLFRRHMILPAWAAEALALWVLHTYAFEWRSVSAYLGIESPEKRCGKTRLLAALAALVQRPVIAANISPSALFRVITETRPTLLIDEADTFLRGKDDLRGALNSGYSRDTAFVVRVANTSGNGGSGDGRKNANGLARFSTWCPKAIAGIGRLPETLADRCILIRMQRKTVGEKCVSLRHLDPSAIRPRCARFAADHGEELAQACPEIPPALNDRAADIWEPLLALAELAGGRWPGLAREAAVKLGAVAAENHSIGALLLDICHAFVGCRAQKMFTRWLCSELNRSGGRGWSELAGGNDLTERRLARLLRPYDIHSCSLRIGDELGRGYKLDDFREAFRRYISSSEVEASMARMRSEASAAGAPAAPREEFATSEEDSEPDSDL